MNDQLRTYRYHALSPSGTRIKNAKMVAFSAEAVRGELLEQGFIPIEITEMLGGFLIAGLRRLRTRGPRMSIAVRSAFTRQLHELLKAGIPATRSLETLAANAGRNPAIETMCRDLANRIQAGQSLTDAFAAYPTAFTPIYLAYIRAGEQTGEIVGLTGRLAHLEQRRSEMRTKVVSVSAYPVMVSIVIAILVTGILIFLVPRFEEMYAGFDAELPAPTQALVAISRRTPLILGIVALSAVAMRWVVRMRVDKLPWLGRALDVVKFKTPVTGKLFHRLTLYRWSSTLGGAMAAGLTQIESLGLAIDAAGSHRLRLERDEWQRAIQSGQPLSGLLGRVKGMFPPMVSTMTAVGEEAGELPELLGAATEALGNEIDALVATMGAKIEVALLMVMGVVVGGILIVLYLPILNMATAMSGG